MKKILFSLFTGMSIFKTNWASCKYLIKKLITSKEQKSFSIAEGMVLLLLTSVALSFVAPLISKRTIQNQQIASISERMIPSGAIMFFDLENCPQGWTNVTSKGWGGRFFRVADEINTRNTPQNNTILSHTHNATMQNFSLPNVTTVYNAQGGGCPSGTCNVLVSSQNSILNLNGTINANISAFGDTETRPDNIPLTTCRKD